VAVEGVLEERAAVPCGWTTMFAPCAVSFAVVGRAGLFIDAGRPREPLRDKARGPSFSWRHFSGSSLMFLYQQSLP
jgi:hypothetical protein